MICHRPFFFAILLLSFPACVSTSLPQVIIPENPGQLDVSASIGTNGAHLNMSCATGKQHFMTGALHRGQFQEGEYVIYGELGAGYITPDHKKSILLSFGHGKFSFFPNSFGLGGTPDQYENYYGHYFRTSIEGNIKFDQNFGVVGRLNIYTGTDNGYRRSQYFSSFYNRSVFSVVAEPALYLKTRKKSAFLFVFGTSGALINANTNTDPAIFRTSNVYITVGANLNLLKGRRRTDR